ncbi:MAG: hypothetical protein N3A38_11105 [Planctomycetota bacterium]|nr:hypothetical protein [Planctomycetota bacterium]
MEKRRRGGYPAALAARMLAVFAVLCAAGASGSAPAAEGATPKDAVPEDASPGAVRREAAAAEGAPAREAAKDLRKRPEAREVLKAFVEACGKYPALSAGQRSAVAAAWEGQKGRGDDWARDFIPTCLSALFPEFKAALDALAAEKTDDAAGRLAKLAASDFDFLAAHASYFLARAHVDGEYYERALPLLEDLSAGRFADKTLYSGDALFLAGVCHGMLFQKEKALDALRRFAREYPDAPERLLVGARQLMFELENFREGTLPDAHKQMGDSRRRLAHAESGKEVRERQEKIIAVLDKLIREAEEQENHGGGGGGGGGGGEPEAAAASHPATSSPAARRKARPRPPAKAGSEASGTFRAAGRRKCGGR